ncbi:MAG: DNA mismatch repair endonuclease MutL [Bdellovibrionales bacterium]|nr:DNA mismatch repair endonuclease MutL [Bdellovibrionales bacterium]
MKIHVLKDHVINRIAAGEVVERPASIVRELVDNAIDAKSHDIRIALDQGGRSQIQVLDDGEGMNRDDAILAFERHATSKIREAEDIEHIATMGFRGEALPSIAAVSRVSLRTRTPDEPLGTTIHIAGGKVRDVQEVSCAVGSEMTVRGLFFNTPARRKFLKSPRVEERIIKQWVTRASLGYPSVRYRLLFDGREVLHLPRRETVEDRARDIFHGNHVFLEAQSDGVFLRGMVGHPALAQASTGSFVFLVNGRLISDASLLRAVRDGFDTTLKEKEYPVGYLTIELPPEDVDVNVHPQKSEVRFRNQRELFVLVREKVLEAVRSFRAPLSGGASPHSFSPPPSAPSTLRGYAGNAAFSLSNIPQEHEQQSQFEFSSSASVATLSLHEIPSGEERTTLQTLETFRFSRLRYIGQLLECYLVCEYDERLYIVDMHAAHERYNFNLIRNGYRAKKPHSQQLLVPFPVSLTEIGVQNIGDHEEVLEQFGFQIEPFGAEQVVVRSVPSLLVEKDVATLVKEFAAFDYPEATEGRFHEAIDHIAARVACHASIRSGKRMKQEEVYALFEALDSSEFSAACPHGRPVVVSFSEFEVERWFGRDR